ncbi:hypothetical protein HB912_11250 [Listeria aquatica]|uniref:Uncharacterized protein n=1 Tax=Listeria aquatica TaxID=1494960 RepID=A0A841ZS28_9LIST|nr:hypothetical protein [Listeria aquatica]MBC1522222.1 hypothetical protein [Listeria aquatica]
MENIKKINSLVEVVILVLISFCLPVIGYASSIYLLTKKSVFPSWVSFVAVLAIILQTITIICLIIMVVFFSQTNDIDIQTTVQSKLIK